MQVVEYSGSKKSQLDKSMFRIKQKDSIPNYLIKLLSIPNKSGNNFSVSRRTRIDYFLNGVGNCSQQASGMGCILDSLEKKYSIVHILPQSGLLNGSGHSIINYQDSVSFLIDPMYKSVICIDKGMSDNNFMKLSDLRSRKYYSKNLKFIKFFDSPIPIYYYSDSFAIAYAEVNQNEMRKYLYYNEIFINYLNLKESNFTRILINSIDAILFILPKFKVTTVEYKKILEAYPTFIWLKFLGYLFIFIFYILMALLFIKVIKCISNYLFTNV